MHPNERTRHDDRSLGDLFSELTSELTTLVREEASLAKVELVEKGRHIATNAGLLGVGAAIVYAGFLALIAAVIAALGELGVDWWLSALLVAVVVTGVGYVLIQKGIRALRSADLAPREAAHSLREDGEMVKERLR
jgi:uncharacterized membrane protein YqjE